MLALHGTIARRVADELRVELAADEEERLRSARRVRPETYEAYLRGVFYVNQFTPEGFRDGMRHLHEAIASDPADPLAWAGLALGYNVLGHGPNPPDDAFPRARAAALRALSLDASLADAHLALGQVALYADWDWPAAGRGLSRALEANPNHAEARYHHAWYLLLEGREAEAIAEMERAARIDPFTPKYAAWLGYLYWAGGRHDEALREARKVLEVSPEFPVAWFTLGLGHRGRGEDAQAVAAHERAAEHEDWRWPLALTLAHAGRAEQARALAEDVARHPAAYDTLGLSWVYAALGDRDEAFRWLEELVDERLSVAPWMCWYPELRSLRDDPRFQALLRRMDVRVRPGA